MPQLTLKLLVDEYAVGQLKTLTPQLLDKLSGGFYTITHTQDEISVVCQSELFQQQTALEYEHCEFGWRCFKIDQVLAFEQIGIIAGLSNVLKAAEVSLFVISTYNTDYLLVKEESHNTACQALVEAGYIIDR